LPKHYLVEPLFALGGTLGLKGRFEEAIEWEKRALAAADPLLAPAVWVQIAEMHSRRGDTPAALAALDQALALDPYNYAARRKRADLLVASGRLQESLPEFRFLLRVHALADVSLYKPAAEALRKAGYGREANRALALGRRAFPGNI
jgi:tetratricopeptide (TPR) repeat protein